MCPTSAEESPPSYLTFWSMFLTIRVLSHLGLKSSCPCSCERPVCLQSVRVQRACVTQVKLKFPTSQSELWRISFHTCCRYEASPRLSEWFSQITEQTHRALVWSRTLTHTHTSRKNGTHTASWAVTWSPVRKWNLGGFLWSDTPGKTRQTGSSHICKAGLTLKLESCSQLSHEVRR